MKTPEPPHSEERERDRERDRDRDPERGDRGGAKQKSSASSASKSKDLSHVPCKFFKVGGCTAGSSCPFSHTLVEPGGQKESCAWFVKGTCKFGHKCALAHILPGQSMAMDRKNKKAAQIAATTERGEKPERGGREPKGGRPNPRRDGNPSGAPNATNRNNLLGTGSTAPTRMLSPNSSAQGSRPPMMKATLAPSALAPPLASFGDLDDLDGAGQLPTAPAQGKTGFQDNANSITTTDTPSAVADTTTDPENTKHKSTAPPAPLPTSAPRTATTPTKPKHDFGPIGSPPTGSSSRLNLNGAPGTSPQHINGVPGSPGASFIPSSPFSAPGAHSGFLSAGSYNGAAGIASSLNALSIMNSRRGWGGGADTAGSFGGMAPSRTNGGRGLDFDDYVAANRGVMVENAVEDGDLEGFLPSSLTDLLTPEERTRRMSRSNSGQPPPPATALGATFGVEERELSSNAGTGSGGVGHRYSRSVPAPSLLGDIKSIWADNSAIPASPPGHRATPSSSFTARFDSLSANPGTAEDMALSMSLGSAGSGMMSLSPSNASAAFLPGLHSHYLNAKAKQAQQVGLGIGGLGRGALRNPSAPLYGGTSNATPAFSNVGASLLPGATPPSTNVHTHINPHTNAAHPYRATPSPFDLTQQQHLYPHTARPIPSQLPSAGSGGGVGGGGGAAGNNNNNNNNNNGGGGGGAGAGADTGDPHGGTHLLSPSTRALQAHAPGQSLPQGLAAGYSRIHALPPPPALGSPASGGNGVFGTPPGLGVEGATPTVTVGGGPYGGWKAPSSPPGNGTGGLDSMLSRLSYSAAAAVRSGGGGGGNGNGIVGAGAGAGAGTGVTMSPPGLSRNLSGQRYTQPLSPLSGPVVTSNDDDDLFSMDG